VRPGRAGAMRAIAPCWRNARHRPRHAAPPCPRQDRRRPTPRPCAAGASGKNMHQCWSAHR
jgi:hypothetical protein